MSEVSATPRQRSIYSLHDSDYMHSRMSKASSAGSSHTSIGSKKQQIRAKKHVPALEKIDSTDLDNLDEDDAVAEPPLLRLASVDQEIEETFAKPVPAYQSENEFLPEWQILLENQSGLPVMLDRLKLNLSSCKELIQLLKRRAEIEEEYGKQLSKLSATLLTHTQKDQVKPGSYTLGWSSILELHDASGKSRFALANSLKELAESLQTVHKHSERSRKELKETGNKHLKQITESENLLDKIKARSENYQQELEKINEQIDNNGKPKSFMNIFEIHKSEKKLQKLQESCTQKLELNNESFKQQSVVLKELKGQFRTVQLPNILKTLKEIDSECDANLITHLTKYVHIVEATFKKDIIRLKGSSPNSQENCVVNHISAIDDEKDFKAFIQQNCTGDATNISRSISKIVATRQIFGVPLKDLVDREGRIVPLIIEKCTKVIEKHALRSVGIYRLSGTQQKIQQLKSLFETEDRALIIEDAEYLADINSITGVLKLFLKSLPTPLVCDPSYEAFVKVILSNTSNKSQKISQLNQLVSRLPKCHYYCLYYLIQHLRVVASHYSENRMNPVSLGLVFAPLFFRPSDGSEEVPYADQVVELMIENADDIFGESEESNSKK